jgi:hypothetical protein
MKVGKNKVMVDGFEGLLERVEKPNQALTLKLHLPCVLSVRNFDVFKVIKQLAISLEIRSKWWQVDDKYYAILFESRITGQEISKLVHEFEDSVNQCS